MELPLKANCCGLRGGCVGSFDRSGTEGRGTAGSSVVCTVGGITQIFLFKPC